MCRVVMEKLSDLLMEQKKRVHVDLKNKYYLQQIKFLRSAKNWTKRQIEQYQLEQLKKIISFAYSKTIGYKKHFDKYSFKNSS